MSIGLLASIAIERAGAQVSGSAFLNVTPSVRSFALGNTSVVAASGASAIGCNPANAELSGSKYDVMTTYASVMDGGEFQHLAAVMAQERLGMIDALGLSVTRLQVGDFQETDAIGNKTGKGFGSSDTALTFAAAGSFNADLHVGVAAKAVQESIASYKTNVALAADVGMSYTLTARETPLTLAASVVNFGMRTKFIKESDPLPLALKAGASASLGPATGVIEISRLMYDRQMELGLGVEYELSAVSFRLGYAALNKGLDDQSAVHRFFTGLSAGVGIKLGRGSFDYAVSQQVPDFQATQRVSFSMKWGGTADRTDRRLEMRRNYRNDKTWMPRLREGM